MSGARYRWLKLQDGFFTSKRVKKMRRMERGDTYVLIYIKMQLATVQTDGILTYTGIEDSFAEELALDLDESPDDVAETLRLLQRFDLIEAIDDHTYVLPFAVANVGKECDSAKRVRDFRERQALQCNAHVTDSNVNVTNLKRLGNVEVEVDKEVDKEKEVEVEGESPREGKASSDSTLSDRQIAEAIRHATDTWNGLASLGIAPVSRITSGSKRHRNLSARIREYGEEKVIEAMDAIRRSSFLRGVNRQGWVITFDWFILPSNFPKVLDGNYNDKSGVSDSFEWLDQ